VLDHVERRRFLVEPSRKGPAPFLVGTLDVDLDERAGQFLFFPRRGRLAGAKADDHVLPPDRLARVQGDGLDDAVALVEDAEHGNALRHRSHRLRHGRSRLASRHLRRRRILLLRAAATRGERKRDQQRSGKQSHAYSGIQGS
jgi:hypothetical protein